MEGARPGGENVGRAVWHCDKASLVVATQLCRKQHHCSQFLSFSLKRDNDNIGVFFRQLRMYGCYRENAVLSPAWHKEEGEKEDGRIERLLKVDDKPFDDCY